jgi:hypothetical protein
MHVLVQGDRYAAAERALNDEIEGAQLRLLIVGHRPLRDE